MMTQENATPKSVRQLSKNQKMLFAIAGVAAFVLLVFVMGSPKKDSKPKVLEENLLKDTQETYSKGEIERLIKEQILREKDKQKTDETASVPPPKRKLNAPIAVFVKPKEVKKEKAEREEKESKSLGIPSGTKVSAHLANSIFSFNVSSPVIAVSTEPLIKDGVVAVPKGTQFIGEAGVVQTRDRVNIKFHTMVFPGGREMKIRAMALSLDGSGGTKGKVDKQTDRSIFKATGEMVLSAASLVLGTRSRPLTLEDELRLNASRNLEQDAEDALHGIKVEKSITVDAYTPILVLFQDAI